MRFRFCIHIHLSKRSGTPAAKMENQVPEDVVKDRFDRLLKEVQTIAAEVCAVHEGTIQEVLVESVSDHDDHMVTGRLSNNILVHFQGDASMIGDYVNVKLDQCKGFYYIGEQVYQGIFVQDNIANLTHIVGGRRWFCFRICNEQE